MATNRKYRAVAVTAIIASAVGIVIQIVSGVDYPTVPPALIIAAVVVAVTWFGPWRWAPIASVLLGAGTLVGGFANSPWVDRLTGSGGVGQVTGTWLQIVFGAVALVAGAAAIKRAEPAGSRPASG